jgi:hypothetical protein
LIALDETLACSRPGWGGTRSGRPSPQKSPLQSSSGLRALPAVGAGDGAAQDGRHRSRRQMHLEGVLLYHCPCIRFAVLGVRVLRCLRRGERRWEVNPPAAVMAMEPKVSAMTTAISAHAATPARAALQLPEPAVHGAMMMTRKAGPAPRRMSGAQRARHARKKVANASTHRPEQETSLSLLPDGGSADEQARQPDLACSRRLTMSLTGAHLYSTRTSR